MRKVVLLAALLLAACVPGGTNINSYVNSYASSPVPAGTTYVLYPAAEGVSPDDLEFLEYASHIEKALSAKGWRRISPHQQADLAVLVSYGIGDPQQHTTTSALPIFGQTGVQSAYTHGSVNLPTYGNTATYSQTTTYTPSYGITGYVPVQNTYTTYQRWLNVAAFDFGVYLREGKEAQVWRVSVTSSGSTGDLRQIIPYMAASAAPHFGSSTGKAVPVSLKMDGKEIQEFLESNPQPARP